MGLTTTDFFFLLQTFENEKLGESKEVNWMRIKRHEKQDIILNFCTLYVSIKSFNLIHPVSWVPLDSFAYKNESLYT